MLFRSTGTDCTTGTRTYTLRGPNGLLLSDQAGSVTRDYIYLGAQLIAVVRTSGSATVYDVTTDAIGSVRMVTDGTTFDRLKKLIVEQLGVDEEEVTPQASFVEDLNADSLDLVELIMSLEEEFGMEISDEDAEKIQKVSDAVDFIEEHQQ